MCLFVNVCVCVWACIRVHACVHNSVLCPVKSDKYMPVPQLGGNPPSPGDVGELLSGVPPSSIPLFLVLGFLSSLFID